MQGIDHLDREELIALVRVLRAKLAGHDADTSGAAEDLDFIAGQALKVLENSGVPALIYDTEGGLRILAANARVSELSGYSPEEILGRSLRRVLPEEDRKRLERQLALPRQGGVSSTGVWRCRTRAGELREVEVSGYDLAFRGRRARFAMLQDVTHRRREQLIQQRLASIVETSHDAILSRTIDGIVLSWNKAAERLFGWTAAEMVGRSVAPLLPPDTRDDDLAAIRRRILTGEVIENLEAVRLHRDGTRVEVAVNLSPLIDAEGRIVGVSGILRDISATKETERKLAESHAAQRLLAAVVESSRDAIISHSLDGVTLSWNRGAEAMFGYSAREALGRDYRFLTPDAPEDHLPQLRERILAGDHVPAFELMSRHKDGHPAAISVSLAALRGDGGDTVGVVAVARDISAQRRAEDALRESEKQLESILNNAAEGIIVLSASGIVERCNLVGQRMFGYGAQEAKGMDLRHLSVGLAHDDGESPADTPPAWMGALLNARREITGRRRDGSLFPLELALSQIALPSGQHKYTAVVRDITERKSWESRIYQLAYSDSLTGLPNRLLLRDRLEHAIAAAQRNRTLVGVLFFDLDHFKAINDSYGHYVGDQLLKKIAERTKASVREIDTVCRLGGDEFVLVLPELHEPADAGSVARKILAVLSQPYSIDGRSVTITPTVGISIYPHDAADADALVRNADTAMYHAKESGKNRFQFYGAEKRG